MNIYQQLYDLINNLIFGGSVVANTYPDLVITFVCVFAVLFLISIPFILVWKVIKLIAGR